MKRLMMWMCLVSMHTPAHAKTYAFDSITTAVMHHSVYRPYRYTHAHTVLLRPPEQVRPGVYKVVLCRAHFCDTTLQTLLYVPRWKRLFGRVHTDSGIKTIGYPTYEEDALLREVDETHP